MAKRKSKNRKDFLLHLQSECHATKPLLEITHELLERAVSDSSTEKENNRLEWHVRSAANRAYYATYHEVALYLERVKKNIQHQEIIDKLYRFEKTLKKHKRVINKHGKKIEARQIAHYIQCVKRIRENYETLKDLREKADYDIRHGYKFDVEPEEIRSLAYRIIKFSSKCFSETFLPTYDWVA